MVRAVQSTRFPDFGRRLRLVTESCFDIVSSCLLTVLRCLDHEGRCLGSGGPNC